MYAAGRKINVMDKDGNLTSRYFGPMYVHNDRSSTLISTTEYDDQVYNWYDNVTINTGDGNDYINNNSSEVSVNAGAGDDYIYTDGWQQQQVTIRGGAGDDTVNLGSYGGNLIQFGTDT